MNDILKQINAGEVSGVQFKERILDKYDIACELVAFRIFLFNNAKFSIIYDFCNFFENITPLFKIIIVLLQVYLPILYI